MAFQVRNGKWIGVSPMASESIYEPADGRAETNVNAELDRVNTHLITLTNITSNEVEVGKWIDNKKLYRKTIYVAGSVTSGTVIDSSITNQNIDTLVSMNGVCSHGNFYRLNMPVYSSASNYITLQITDSGVTLQFAGFTPTNSVVTIEYTK